MTNKDIFEDAFPQDKQIGGSHYKDFHIQPIAIVWKSYTDNVFPLVAAYRRTVHSAQSQEKKLWPVSAMTVFGINERRTVTPGCNTVCSPLMVLCFDVKLLSMVVVLITWLFQLILCMFLLAVYGTQQIQMSSTNTPAYIRM